MMQSIYHSESVNWSSDPKNGKIHGMHRTVSIKNGKGMRVKETLNLHRKVIQRQRHTLKKGEINDILKGKFVPNLWTRTRTRKSTRRKPAA